jgi:hypothetical protein
MSVYLHPLSIPSRNNSMSDGSPYNTQSTSPTGDAWSSPTTHSRKGSEGSHFLNIPGPTTPHIKDADSVDKEANAAAAAGAATASSCPSSQSEWRKSKVFQLGDELTSQLQKERLDVIEKTAFSFVWAHAQVPHYIVQQ